MHNFFLGLVFWVGFCFLVCLVGIGCAGCHKLSAASGLFVLVVGYMVVLGY